ncbi:GntR family transcriptional regulator [Massilia sp. KIM]|uniref:aminotransferase-like domain-containing protein n=1 Tax=Massilia sp. KIM TaxID=1955422 RepID=UPI00099022CE|nr:PLP-dependent aminotransferase family protein [Massilia sp. KIM]OON63398.1 GntR family transcriptional regulator [Massilia sp. KIM]
MSKANSIQEADVELGWIDLLDRNKGPHYLQIADALERAMIDGRLKPGERLPTQRRLAAGLGVDLTTVTRAYDEARRRHLLEGRGARGTYVAAPKVELAPVLDLSMNTPPPPEGVDFGDLLRQGLSQVLLRADNELLMTYHLGGGGAADRAAGARWLEAMFGRVDPEHVVVCPGAQAALAALVLSLSEPGDTILAEPLVYPGLRAAATQFGRRLQAVETDAHGMLPEALERAALSGARLLYLNPTLQNPTGATMPAQRRREIAALASRLGLRIIEDDPYWLFEDNAPAPLASHAPANAYYVSTLSKCLTPGLRVAFVLAPGAAERSRFLAALRSFALMPAPLTAALATQWIFDGDAARLLDGVRKEAQARQDLAQGLLAGRDQPARRGLHIWLPLPAYWSATELARAAAAEGLAVTPAAGFSAQPPAPNAIRISLGSVTERKRLAGGLRRLSQLLARKPAPPVLPLV